MVEGRFRVIKVTTDLVFYSSLGLRDSQPSMELLGSQRFSTWYGPKRGSGTLSGWISPKRVLEERLSSTRKLRKALEGS